jgi:3-deoxy-manno-octulosonate cytidylyltransferase (CMP-KDO synthetase)
MSQEFHVIIPARYHSTRFPGKLLQEIHGMTVLERVYKQALLAKPSSVTIATDHPTIVEHAQGFGASVVVTRSTHQSGTDRIAEVVTKSNFSSNAVIVNVQADEPFIAPNLILQVAQALTNTDAPMSTLCWPIESLEQLNNSNVVKVTRSKHNKALYFSRSPIPAHRDQPGTISNIYRHIGLYAYRAAFLLEFVTWSVCALEKAEALEQLRVLWEGHSIQVEIACEKPLQDINTPEDLLLYLND